MTRAEIHAHQERRKQFLATPLGAAFYAYERALENYWHADGQDGSWIRLKNLDESMKAAKSVLMPLLREAAGLEK